MRKKFNLLFVLILSLNFTFLTGCDNSEGGILYSVPEEETSQPVLSDYELPEKFAMTLKLSDTSIFNKGTCWYFKTARIGNDWQTIEYDRDLEDRTKQKTHFFKYISEDNYTHYSYDYSKSDWTKMESGSFFDMAEINLNNFKFLEVPPSGPNINLVETEVQYDTDATSITEYIDAIKYEYSYTLDYELIFDAAYYNMCLSECCRDGSTVCTEWSASDYETTITDWDSFYLSYRNFKPIPGSATEI